MFCMDGLLSDSTKDTKRGWKKAFPFPVKELEAIHKDNRGGMLSDRELEILKLVADGYSSKQVADKLFLSELTVNTHRCNMLKKTN